MKLNLVKWGNSAAVRIPSKGHEQKGYRPGLIISDPIK